MSAEASWKPVPAVLRQGRQGTDRARREVGYRLGQSEVDDAGWRPQKGAGRRGTQRAGWSARNRWLTQSGQLIRATLTKAERGRAGGDGGVGVPVGLAVLLSIGLRRSGSGYRRQIASWARGMEASARAGHRFDSEEGLVRAAEVACEPGLWSVAGRSTGAASARRARGAGTGRGPDPVRISCCGVCRTDCTWPRAICRRRPEVTVGHEIVGRSTQLGTGAARFAVGDRIGVPWLAHRRDCAFCRRGAENLCLRPTFTGLDIDGGYAEACLADEAYVYELPESSTTSCRAAAVRRDHRLPRAAASRGPAGGRLGIYGFGGSAHIAAQIALHQGLRVHVLTRAKGTASSRPRLAPMRRRRDGPAADRWTAQSCRARRRPRPGRPAPSIAAAPGHRRDLPVRHPAAQLRGRAIPGARACASPPTPAGTARIPGPGGALRHPASDVASRWRVRPRAFRPHSRAFSGAAVLHNECRHHQATAGGLPGRSGFRLRYGRFRRPRRGIQAAQPQVAANRESRTARRPAESGRRSRRSPDAADR